MKSTITAFLIVLLLASPAVAAKRNRPTPPTRDPHTPGYVEAKELPDGEVPPADADGNFIIGPTHKPAPEMVEAKEGLRGKVFNFTMKSSDSKIYPGIAREADTYGTPDPKDPTKLVVTTSHAAPYTRKVAVYVPKQYKPGTAAPFIVGADGPDKLLFTALDNLIAQKRVPVMIAISVANGSGEVLSIKIDKSVVDPEDVEMLEDLVNAAVGRLVEIGQRRSRRCCSERHLEMHAEVDRVPRHVNLWRGTLLLWRIIGPKR